MRLALLTICFLSACNLSPWDTDYTLGPEDFGLTPEQVREKNLKIQAELVSLIDKVAGRTQGLQATVNVYAAKFEEMDNGDGTKTKYRTHEETPKSTTTRAIDDALVADWKKWVEKRGLKTVYFAMKVEGVYMDVSWQDGADYLISNGATITINNDQNTIKVSICEAQLSDKTEYVFQLPPGR